MSGHRIVPVEPVVQGLSYRKIIEVFSATGLEARKTADAAYLLEDMIKKQTTIWLGIAGIAAVEGMDGYISKLMKRGFIRAICTTGAQAYHSLHSAYGYPIVQGDPNANDNELREYGVVRIYDAYIDEDETLLAQDKIIRDFCTTLENGTNFSSAGFNYALGNYVLKTARYPERSFIAQAAKYGVPVFYDSGSNHSIGMNLAAEYLSGREINLSPNLDILESAAIVYYLKSIGFLELGGGGPKNFIQQTGPTIKQILGIDYEGADCGIQISMAIVNDGALSSCTFNEGKTWGKFENDSGLVQVFGEYITPFLLIAGYVLENCPSQPLARLVDKRGEMVEMLKRDRKR